MALKEQSLITAVVATFIHQDITGKSRLLLKNVCVNKKQFRNHSWIRVCKRTKHLKRGDTIMAFGKTTNYNTEKKGIKALRCLETNSNKFKDYYKEETEL